MKKQFSLLIVALFISLLSFAQPTYNTDIGASGYISLKGGFAPAFTYSPRVNILPMGGGANTVSVGTHLAIGYVPNSQDIMSGLMLDAPLVADYNIGAASSIDADAAFGEFFGAGVEANLFGSFPASNVSFGPMLEAGIRFRVNEYSYGLRASYVYNTLTDGAHILSLGFFYTFGSW